MLVLLTALREELGELRKRMAIEDAFARQDCPMYKGKYGKSDVLLAQTGMGKEKAERAAEFILGRYPVAALISLGFAGALAGGLRVGDIVICAKLHLGDESGKCCCSDAKLVSIAVQTLQDRDCMFRQGNSVTVARPVSGAKAKSALGRSFSAEVVDMEGYWIARMAADCQIPFLSVRAVSDDVEDTLPPFERFMDSGGAWHRKEAVLYFLSRPWQAVRLISLYRNARRARESLATFMDCFAAAL